MPEVADDFANLLAFALAGTEGEDGVLLLRLFDNKEQAEWNSEWAVHPARFAKEIGEEAAEAAKKAGVPVPSKLTPEQLRELAFAATSAWSASRRASGGGQPVAKARQRARPHLRDRLEGRGACRARNRCWPRRWATRTSRSARRRSNTCKLGMDKATLGGEALEAGYTDLGEGPELLTDGTKAPRRARPSSNGSCSPRSDDLAIEAAKPSASGRTRSTWRRRASDSCTSRCGCKRPSGSRAQYEESADAQKFSAAAGVAVPQGARKGRV